MCQSVSSMNELINFTRDFFFVACCQQFQQLHTSFHVSLITLVTTPPPAAVAASLRAAAACCIDNSDNVSRVPASVCCRTVPLRPKNVTRLMV